MDNSTPGIEQLTRYLDGEMGITERQDFERLLEINEHLRNELNDLRSAKEAIIIYGLKENVSKLHKGMMKELRNETPVRNIRRRTIRYTLAIASGLALIIAGYLAFRFFTLSSEKLYSEQYSAFELTVVRDQSQKQSTIQKLYSEKDYKAVIEEKSKMAAVPTTDLFVSGLSYLELNEPTSAINIFNEVFSRNKISGEKIYQDEAEFYLALAYLKIKEYDKAIELMNKIHNDPQHPYHKKFSTSFIRKVKMLKWR